MKTVKFQLEPLTCPSCINKIENVLSRKDGVKEVRVLFNSSKVKVSFNEETITPAEIIGILNKLGYPIKSAETAA